MIRTYRTTDLAISSYLAISFKIISCEKLEGNRFEFVFEKTKELENHLENYFNNSAKVSPIAYFNSIKSIKSRIYSER